MANDLKNPKDYAKQVRQRIPPSLATEMTSDNEAGAILQGDAGRIDLATGGGAVADGLLKQIMALGSHGKQLDDGAASFALGFVDAMEPRDAVEVLLCTQMAAIHQATMMMARRLNHADNIPQQDAAERALNKLSRTFTTQVHTLKRYRSKGQHIVRVERVTVQDGGQAVVGNVNSGT